jgi:hypothetical protein
MNNFRKILVGAMLVISGVLVMGGTVLAEDAKTGTILPTAATPDKCQGQLDEFIKQVDSGNKISIEKSVMDSTLGCAVVTGKVSLAMVPYFIKYLSDYVLGLISLVALLFVVIGGVMYTGGSMVEQKDQGKAFIKNALIGMVISFLAWSIVNVVLSIVSG